MNNRAFKTIMISPSYICVSFFGMYILVGVVDKLQNVLFAFSMFSCSPFQISVTVQSGGWLCNNNFHRMAYDTILIQNDFLLQSNNKQDRKITGHFEIIIFYTRAI